MGMYVGLDVHSKRSAFVIRFATALTALVGSCSQDLGPHCPAGATAITPFGIAA